MRKYLDIPLTLIMTLMLAVAMLWPLEAPPPAPEGSDKIVHFIAFAALAFPLARTGRFGLLPVFIGASAFGGLIELIQTSFNRRADVNDWVADIVASSWRLGVASSTAVYVDTNPHFPMPRILSVIANRVRFRNFCFHHD